MDNSAKTAYDNGWRAYDGVVQIFRNHADNDATVLNDNDELWHALRAYQDEQRKKGVPIVSHFVSLQNTWYTMDRALDNRKYNFCADDAPRLPMVTPEIWILAGSNNVVVGKFTNFRWRAGYPKNV